MTLVARLGYCAIMRHRMRNIVVPSLAEVNTIIDDPDGKAGLLCDNASSYALHCCAMSCRSEYSFQWIITRTYRMTCLLIKMVMCNRMS